MIRDVALSDIAIILMGQSPPGDTYNTTGEGLPFFQGKAEFGDESPTPVKWCSAPSRIAEAGDILLTVRAPVGPTNIATERCCIGRGLAAIRAKEGVALTRYLRYFFRRFESEISAKGVGSTFAAINRNDIERLRLVLPPLDEQHRIVRILDEAEALRQLRARADERMADFIPALFNQMFGDPATNPKGWPSLELQSVCKQITDGTHQPPPFSSDGIPFLFVQNIVNGYLDFNTKKYITEETFDELAKRMHPEYGDILYSIVGSYGVAVLVETDRKFSFQRHIGYLKPNRDRVDARFLCAQMNMPHIKSQVDQRVRGVAQKTLNLGEIKRLEVLVPPLALQHDFAARVAEARALQDRQARSRSRLEAGFQALLHRAFAGEL